LSARITPEHTIRVGFLDNSIEQLPTLFIALTPCRGLDLHPVARAARAVLGVSSFRDHTFKAKFVHRLEQHVAVNETRYVTQARQVRALHKLIQQGLAINERHPSQILTLTDKKVERHNGQEMTLTRSNRPSDREDITKSIVFIGDQLAVEYGSIR